MNFQAQIETVRRYLACLHASDTAGLIDCFEPEGRVFSPFLGEMLAKDFFPKLRAASRQSVITPIDLLSGVAPDSDIVRVAAYFRYDWTLNDGRLLTFTCVDMFGFTPGSARMASMHILYDTHPLRQEVGDKYAAA